MQGSYLKVDGLTKRFGDHVAANDISLNISRGEVLALLGPSGSGKTTMLRLLAGFEQPDSGSILLDGIDLTQLRPAERRFGMVFQHYALFPHLTAGENVAFGLSDLSDKDAARRVAEVMDLVDLAGFQHREVSSLSGGQQQRIAVARALAPNPRVLLLDEPLSNLDPTLREKTRTELRTALKEIGITTIFVTHEQEEAFALGDVVAVLREGKVEQIGAAPELYENPANKFVATFVGRASSLDGTMLENGRVKVGEGVEWESRPAAGVVSGAAVDVVVRPEHLSFGETGLAGVIRSVRYNGARAYFTVDVSGENLEVESSVHSASVGDSVRVSASQVYIFVKQPA